MIEVVDAGPLTTVQDLGRAGYAALGVPRSGAFDRAAAALANRLVGNEPSHAVLELTLGGLCFLTHDAVTVAATGALCPGLDWGAPVTLHPGAVIRLGTPQTGLRSYLALRGGVDVQPVLGSRSTDRLSLIGPAPLARGDLIAVGPQPDRRVSDTTSGITRRSTAMRISAGPRVEWFSASGLADLCSTDWVVRSDSDRIGVRLDGPPLARMGSDELPSEATLPGAIQIPPDGRPIILGPDAPVTGGYPVIAVLDHIDDAAQLRPGDLARFLLT